MLAGQSSKACPRCGGACLAARQRATGDLVLAGMPSGSLRGAEGRLWGSSRGASRRRVKDVDHGLSECAARVIDSPAASRRVLQAMASLAREGTLSSSSKWSGTVIAANRLGAELERNRRT